MRGLSVRLLCGPERAAGAGRGLEGPAVRGSGPLRAGQRSGRSGALRGEVGRRGRGRLRTLLHSGLRETFLAMRRVPAAPP